MLSIIFSAFGILGTYTGTVVIAGMHRLWKILRHIFNNTNFFKKNYIFNTYLKNLT